MERPAGQRRNGILLALILGIFVLYGPTPAGAYKVCHDPGRPCVHEQMARDAVFVLGGGGEIAGHIDDLEAGAGHEDIFDHVFGYEMDATLKDAFVTITHFWDADAGNDDRVEIAGGLLDYPNAWQKAKSLWSMALATYADGNKDRAYELLGHIAHLVGDLSVPTHAHDDTHVPIHDDDPFEEWMGGDGDGELFTHPATAAELEQLKALGPVNPPANQPDKLEWILYTMSQIGDFFPSMDVEGDAVDPRGWAQGELNTLNSTVSTPRTIDDLEDNDDGNHDDDGDLSVIREHSYKRGIRAIAGLYKLFGDTVAQTTLRVVWDRLEEDEDHDNVGDKPDYFTEVTINGRTAQNRGDRVRDNNNLVNPGFMFAHPVGTSGSAPVQLKVFDWDGWVGNPFDLDAINDDDLSDIDPTDEDDDSVLDFNVDLGKCLRREPGAITGDVSGKCGDQIVTGGDDGSEATKVYFRVLMSKSPPVADAAGPYTTPEGTNVELNGTGSTDPDNDITTYAWDLDGDGACDDVANDSTPDFTAVGQDGTTTVKLCVTDAAGLTDEDTATVTVTNVTPSLPVSADAPKGENTTVTVSGTISDPGWLDSLTGTISWGDGGPAQPLGGTLENTRPNATLTFSVSHTYGDNGTFAAQVCAADDDTNLCTTIPLQVDNTRPTATIDLSGATSVNGTPTIIAHAGQAVGFSGRSTDPGSDDLTLAWAWGDGTPGSTTTSLVNPPNPDPAMSPSIQPRDVTSTQSHAFGGACVYETSFTSTDDDGDAATSKANVIIVGNNHPNRGHGYWKQQFRYHLTGKSHSDFDATTLGCYLKIADYMSRVFNDATAAATFAQAAELLDTSGPKPVTYMLDVHLLAVWLNFANGAMEFDRMVDSNGDRIADTPFLDAVAAAEAVRLNPASTKQQLEKQKQIVESWLSLP